ncbi:hypothetical protein NMG60_11026976 [Bertholletia excelsa]
MQLNWKWSSEKQYPLCVKLVVSILFLGLAFRLLFYRTNAFLNVSETLVSVDFQENRDRIPENGTQLSNNFNRSVSVDLDQSRYELTGKLNQYPENSTQASENPSVSPDLEQNKGQIDEHNGAHQPDNPKPSVSDSFPESRDQITKKEKCDLFTGDWIPSSSGPRYTNETCSLIEGHQNCMKNGRPDTGYLYWRWNPRDCELRPFDAELFLELMRNKSWAFIGDSISRNHVQSLLCTLSKVEQAVEVYHDEQYRSKRWHFPSYNFTVSVLWSPFLAKAATFEDYNGVSTADIQLHLDKLDSAWTNEFQSLDYMIFSSGKWFLKTAFYYENDTTLGCHNCPNKNQTELGFDFSYRKVLQNVFNFIVSSNHTGTIIYTTSSPDHFENGEWYNGGSCRRTEPVKEGELEVNELNKILRAVEMEEFEKAAAKASEWGINLKLLDVMQLSLLRPDGHPGLYRYFHPYDMDNSTKIFYDCLHWCLPGPIDSWNDLLMEMVLR